MGEAFNTLLADAAYKPAALDEQNTAIFFLSFLLALANKLVNLFIEDQQRYPRLRLVLAIVAIFGF